MPCTVLSSIPLRPVLILMAIALLGLMMTPAQAQTNSGSFTLKISEKEMNLEHPDEMEWQKYVMWDLGFQRMTDRNMPYLELTNDSSSTAPITRFRLTIGDERFNFTDELLGTYAMLAETTPGFQITSSTVDDAGDELVVDIGDGGLEAGETVRFKIDLNVDPTYLEEPHSFFEHPDFRTVLFDMNGLQVYDGLVTIDSTDDNAMARALFSPASGADFTSGPAVFSDDPVIGPEAQFFNANYRRYNEPDPVRTFQALGQGETIPEPGSVALACLGMIGGLLTWRRSRRSPQAV